MRGGVSQAPEFRIAAFRERLVQAFAVELGFLGELCSPCASVTFFSASRNSSDRLPLAQRSNTLRPRLYRAGFQSDLVDRLCSFSCLHHFSGSAFKKILLFLHFSKGTLHGR